MPSVRPKICENDEIQINKNRIPVPNRLKISEL
jgi:hypothetical protein